MSQAVTDWGNNALRDSALCKLADGETGLGFEMQRRDKDGEVKKLTMFTLSQPRETSQEAYKEWYLLFCQKRARHLQQLCMVAAELSFPLVCLSTGLSLEALAKLNQSLHAAAVENDHMQQMLCHSCQLISAVCAGCKAVSAVCRPNQPDVTVCMLM